MDVKYAAAYGGELKCDNKETAELKYFPLDKTPALFCKQYEELLSDVKSTGTL